MKIELNLDTPEKQALFLMLFNDTGGIVEKVANDLKHTDSEAPGFQRTLLCTENLAGLLESVFSYDDWVKVYEGFNQ